MPLIDYYLCDNANGGYLNTEGVTVLSGFLWTRWSQCGFSETHAARIWMKISEICEFCVIGRCLWSTIGIEWNDCVKKPSFARILTSSSTWVLRASQTPPRNPSLYPLINCVITQSHCARLFCVEMVVLSLWHRQHCCEDASQISEWQDTLKHNFYGYQTLRDRICLIIFWNGLWYSGCTYCHVMPWHDIHYDLPEACRRCVKCIDIT